MLLVDGSGAVIVPKWQCVIEVNFGWCGGGLALDWVYLCKFSTIFLIIGVLAIV